jgi:hypothetical protein
MFVTVRAGSAGAESAAATTEGGTAASSTYALTLEQADADTIARILGGC